MLLTIGYQNGEQRVIHLTKEFFTAEPMQVFNEKLHRKVTVVETPAMKAVALANCLGINPFTIRLERNGAIQFNNTNFDNKPAPMDKIVKVDEKAVKKLLKQEYRASLLKVA